MNNAENGQTQDIADSLENFNRTQKKASFHIGHIEIGKERPFIFRRHIWTQEELDQHFRKPIPTPPSLKHRLHSCFSCKRKAVLQYLGSLFPFISVLKTYKISYTLHDFVSGITIGCLSFPLGIAFGVLASLNPAYGLYSSFFPVILYLMFGTSRHVSFGTNGIISLFTRDMIHSHLPFYTAGQNTTAIEHDIELKSAIASGSTCIIGIILLFMGLFRLGFIVNYISSSFVSGFTTAGGVHIVTSQIPTALGIEIPRFTGPGHLIFTYKAIFEAIPRIHVASLIASVITAIILILFKDIINVKYKDKLKSPIPIDFIIIIIATLLSYFTGMSDRFGMEIVGDIPAGIPPPKLPFLSINSIFDSLVIAIMIFVLSVSMSRLCEAAHNYRVDDNQELVAYGLSNIGSSFFHCFPSSTGPARTITLCLMGPKSTLHGLVSSTFILLILLCVGPLFRTLPVSVLSTMVIIAVKSLVFQMKELPELWRLNRYDFFIALGTNVSGCFIAFPYGLYVGVILCMFTVILQSQNSKNYILSKLVDEDRFLNEQEYNGCLHHPRISIFKFESSLYFATAELFRTKLYHQTRHLGFNTDRCKKSVILIDQKSSARNLECLNRESVESFTRLPWHGLHDKTLHNKDYVIIDCSSINYIDVNGLRILIQVICEMENEGVTVVFASCNQYVKNFFRKSDLASKISSEHIYVDVTDAFNALSLEGIA